jgi:hypothetical protein
VYPSEMLPPILSLEQSTVLVVKRAAQHLGEINVMRLEDLTALTIKTYFIVMSCNLVGTPTFQIPHLPIKISFGHCTFWSSKYYYYYYYYYYLFYFYLFFFF